MLVDPELLRAFAARTDAAVAEMSGTGVEAAASAADGLPGSDTQWAVHRVGAHLALAAKDVLTDICAMGQAVRGAGDRYEVEDSGLAGTFTRLF